MKKEMKEKKDMEKKMKCENCGKEISAKVEKYSREHFKKALCFECQKEINQEEKPVPVEEVNDAPDKPQSAKKGPEGVSPENIITLQGKQFITHAGLLEVAHQKGLRSITTEMLTPADAETVIFKATVTMYNKEKVMETKFTGHGDANKENVNNMIFKHKIRMAETRSLNRALRFATNIGMCSAEELGE